MKMQCNSTEEVIKNREKLINLFKTTPLPVEQLMTNLHMYMRSTILAKVLYLNELYEQILKTPGCVFEFGAWWGANMVTFENLRTVYEPYNYTRKIIGFDTFNGYENLSEKDKGALMINNNYATTQKYEDYLQTLLEYHRHENAMPNKKKYEIIKGDVTKTIKEYLKIHPETIIALAYFDMQVYTPTKVALEAILPYLTKGSVIAMDEINHEDFQGETIAFQEVIGTRNCRLIKSRYLPDRNYFIIE